MNLSNLLGGAIGDNIVQNLAGQFGLDQNQTENAISSAVPMILGALGKNALTNDGANSLNSALDKKHDGSLLDNLSGILQNNSSDLQKDGSSILGHIFGGQVNNVESNLSEKTGISLDKIKPLLATIAPMVMAYLGKEKKNNNIGVDGLGGLLGGLLGGGKKSGGVMDMVTGLLDKDGDGSAIDDIMGMFGKK